MHLSTNSLTGMNRYHPMNLSGKQDIPFQTSHYKINLLKQHVFNHYLLPLYSEQWDVLTQNIVLIDQPIQQLQTYYKTYKTDDLACLLELLKLIQITLDQHQLIGQNTATPTFDKNNIIRMVYRTTKLRLMPEYELYHHIIGKPNVTTHECYQENILQDIRAMMLQERIQFQQIQTYIEEKYKNNKETSSQSHF